MRKQLGLVFALALATAGSLACSSGGGGSGHTDAGGGTTGTGGSAGGTGGSGTGGGGSGGSAQAGAGGAGGQSSGGGGVGGAGGTVVDAGADGGGMGGKTDAGAGAEVATRPARVLLYSFSTLDIPTVPAQLTILKTQLEAWNYQVDESKDPTKFTDAGLANYAAVAMVNTCFFPFGANASGVPEAQALQRFLKQGGGLFGVHCAAVTFQSSNPPHLYNQLIGGRGNNGSYDGTSACTKMGDHPTIAALPATFNFTGNLDNVDYVAPDTVVLVRCAWGNGKNPMDAVSWYRNEGPGRVFFTSFAKEDKDLTDATLGTKHIIPGLAWVLGR